MQDYSIEGMVATQRMEILRLKEKNESLRKELDHASKPDSDRIAELKEELKLVKFRLGDAESYNMDLRFRLLSQRNNISRSSNG